MRRCRCLQCADTQWARARRSLTAGRSPGGKHTLTCASSGLCPAARWEKSRSRLREAAGAATETSHRVNTTAPRLSVRTHRERTRAAIFYPLNVPQYNRTAGCFLLLWCFMVSCQAARDALAPPTELEVHRCFRNSTLLLTARVSKTIFINL